jgi:hypothetical protein
VNTGIGNTPDTRGLRVFAHGGYLQLERGPVSGTLTLSDATGRMIGQYELAREQQQVALPSQYVGPLLWRVQGTDGRVRSGRIMVQ